MSGALCTDTMLEMGNINPHTRFVHLYFNGTYWGQYNLHERWNADMVSQYAGGEKEDYEVVIPDAVDVMDGCISVSSPLGRAFMDRQVNDVVTVRLPMGTRELRIEKLQTLHDQAQEQLNG